MPNTVGQVTAYDLTTGVVVNMDELIYLYSPEELPLLTGMGSDGLSVLATAGVTQVEFSWLDEDNLAPVSTLGGATTTGDTFITVASGDQLRFSTGDTLVVRKAGGNEVMRCTGYGITTDTLLVTRAWAGTATNYASGAKLLATGTALAEGSDPENARSRDTSKRTNCTQIFGPTALAMSGTNLVIPRYGIPDQWGHQVHHRMFENALSRENAVMYGRYVNSTTLNIRTTGGFAEFITTNLDATNTTITTLKLQANLQLCYNQGGMPDRFLTNPACLVDLNDIANTSVVRVTDVDTMRGRNRVAYVETEFGTLTVVRSRWVAPTDAFAIKRENCRRRILRPMVFEPLAKTGDSRRAQIVCEEGVQIKGEKHMFRMNSLGY